MWFARLPLHDLVDLINDLGSDTLDLVELAFCLLQRKAGSVVLVESVLLPGGAEVRLSSEDRGAAGVCHVMIIGDKA